MYSGCVIHESRNLKQARLFLQETRMLTCCAPKTRLLLPHRSNVVTVYLIYACVSRIRFRKKSPDFTLILRFSVQLNNPLFPVRLKKAAAESPSPAAFPKYFCYAFSLISPAFFKENFATAGPNNS